LFIKKFVGLSSVSAKIQTKLAVTEDSIYRRQNNRYTAFGTWWHTVTHGRGSEGETGEWSG